MLIRICTYLNNIYFKKTYKIKTSWRIFEVISLRNKKGRRRKYTNILYNYREIERNLIITKNLFPKKYLSKIENDKYTRAIS